MAISYSWNGTTPDWGEPANWTPNGVPTSGDNVVIVAKSAVPMLSAPTSVVNFTITSGSLNLNTHTLTITGLATLTKGSLSNGTIVATGATTTFGDYNNATSGVVIDAIVSVTSSTITVSYSTFQQELTLNKHGGWLDNSAGGNTFNGDTYLISSGSASFRFGWKAKDTFNGKLYMSNTSNPYGPVLGWGNFGHAYNNDIYIKDGSMDIRNGFLGEGVRILEDPSGFFGGTLGLGNIVQLDNTPQTFIFDYPSANINNGGGQIRPGNGTVFNGDVHFKVFRIYLDGCTFNGAATLEQTAWRTNGSQDGGWYSSTVVPLTSQGYTITPTTSNTTTNVFNGPTMIIATSAEGCTPDVLKPVVYNNDVEFTLVNQSFLSISHNSNGIFNGNVGVNFMLNTLSGGVRFGILGYTSTLAANKTLTVRKFTSGTLTPRTLTSVGTFNGGTLTLRGFKYENTSPPAITLTGNASLRIATGSLFKGPIQFTVPHVYLDGGTFEGEATFIKKATGANNSLGGNVFHKKLTLINQATGTAPINMATSLQDQIIE